MNYATTYLFSTVTTLLSLSLPAFAGTLYFDTDDVIPGAGTPGAASWDAAANWSTDSTGAGAPAAWVDGEDAVFSAGTEGVGTWNVAITGTVQTKSILFNGATNSTLHNILGGTIDSGTGPLVLNATAAGITTGRSKVISSAITGIGGVTIRANGSTSATGDSSNTVFRINGANTFTGGVTIESGVVATNSIFGDAGNVITMNGGGLVDPNLGTTLTRDIQVGAAGGVYRTYGSTGNGTVPPATLDGSLSNVPGVATTTFRHTDGGVLAISGNGSGFAGTFTNERGALRITRPNADWAGTDFVFTSFTTSATNLGTLTVNNSSTATMKSLLSVRDVILENGSTLNLLNGLTMATNAHWVKTNTGTVGNLTSSTGTLTVTNGAAAGTLSTLDHQLQVVVADSGATPVTLVKNGVNQLNLTRVNAHTGGTTVNAGRIGATGIDCFSTGGVTVNSGGQVYLAAAAGSVYPATANFAINGQGQTETAGTLGALRYQNTSTAGSVTVASAARITAHSLTTGGMNGALLGSGALEINSSATSNNGTISLNGDGSAYSGTVSVTQGQFSVNSTLGGTLNFTSNALSPRIGGEGTVANLTLNGNLTTTPPVLMIDPNSPGALTATALTATDVTAVDLTAASTVVSPVVAVKYGTFTGSAANFALVNEAKYRAPATTRFIDDTANKQILVDLGATMDLVWNGTTGPEWDSLVSARWNAGEADKFAAGDRVTFNNDGQNSTVTIAGGTVNPASILVDSTAGARDYTITASTGNTIAGGAKLTKRGTSTLSLAGAVANTHTGGTLISQGTVVFGNGGSLGTGTITINDALTGTENTALLGSAAFTVPNPIIVTAEGTGTVGIGSTVFTPSPAAPVLYSGLVTLNRPTTLIAGSSDRTTFTGRLTGPVGTLTIAGGRRITLDSNLNDFTGDVVIKDSGSILQVNHVSGVIPNASLVNMDTGTNLYLNVATNETVGALVSTTAGGGNVQIHPSVAGNHTITVGGADKSGDFSGTIVTGGTGTRTLTVTKVGTGRQSLTGANNYGADGRGTNVELGTLAINVIADTAPEVSNIGYSTGLNVGFLGVNNGATLEYMGSTISTTARNLWVDRGAGATFNITSPTGGIVFTGTGGSRNKPIVKDGPGSLSIAGALAAGATTTVNDGTLTLAGTSTYDASTVAGGLLVISGTATVPATSVTAGGLHVTGTLNSAVTLTAGTLSGTGTVNGAVNAAGTIAPGASAGTLTVTGATGIEGTAILAAEVDGAAADRLQVNSACTITPGAALNISTLAGGATEPSYVLVDSTGLTGTFSAVTGVPAGYQLAYTATQVQLNKIAGYDSWIADPAYAALSAADKLPGADPDGDGLANLLEYVLGGNPVAGGTEIAPAVTVGTDLVFTFSRTDLSETDSTQIVQYGSDLAGWTDVTIGAASGASGAVTYTVTENGTSADSVTVTIPRGSELLRFARLKVTRP